MDRMLHSPEEDNFPRADGHCASGQGGTEHGGSWAFMYDDGGPGRKAFAASVLWRLNAGAHGQLPKALTFLASKSPAAKAALAEYERIKAADGEAGYDCHADPEHKFYRDPGARVGGQLHGSDQSPQTLPPPGWLDRPEPEAEPNPRIRTVKDEGWG